MEQGLVERAAIDFSAIGTGQLRSTNPLRAAINLLRMGRGFVQSYQAIRLFRPHVCLVTGGYVCVPVSLACRLLGVPMLVYLPDMTPGLAIRFVSRLAQRVAVTVPSVARYFGGLYPQGKGVVTGYPVRHSLVAASKDRREARRLLDRYLDQRSDLKAEEGILRDDEIESERAELLPEPRLTYLPLTLIWGGSLGARSINLATWSALADILGVTAVLHVVGTRDWPLYLKQHIRMVRQLPEAVRDRYHPIPYLHEEMVLALAAADLSVARAGASVLGEFPVARLPSILVPLPHSGVNQMENARMLVDKSCAIIVEDRHLERDLAGSIMNLVRDESLRSQMEQNLATIAQPDALSIFEKELTALAEPSTRKFT